MNRNRTRNSKMHRCRFQWDIYNPFRTWQKLEAKFYQESPTLTPWKVSLEPVDRGTNYWNFLFSLEYVYEFRRHEEIVVQDLLVFVWRGVDLIKTLEEEFYNFCNDNRFQYNVQGTVEVPLQTEPHDLIITMEFALPDMTIREPSFGSNSRDEDFACLSKNMRELFQNECYHNMCMLSADPEQYYRVHSFVINERWNKFFSLHPRQNLRDGIKVNISHELLSDILIFMYSGEVRRNWPKWKDSSYATELCQVIFRYDLFDLYKIIVKSDMMHQMETRNTCHHESHLFPLEIVGGRPVKNASFSWIANPNSNYEILFVIRVGGEYGNWLSYSLKSRSKFRVSVEVNFQIVKKMEGNPKDPLFHVHGATYDIDPRETKDSGPKIFLGCPETFGASNEAGIEYDIRCFLNVFDGTKVDMIHCLGEEALQDDSERFRLLSLFMGSMRMRRVDADMFIYSKFESSHFGRVKEKIHKGMLVTRVPEWWKGLNNAGNTVLRLARVPERANFTLSISCFLSFLQYLYTGDASTNHSYFDLDELKEFAEQTKFGSLNDFVGRLASS